MSFAAVNSKGLDPLVVAKIQRLKPWTLELLDEEDIAYLQREVARETRRSLSEDYL